MRFLAVLFANLLLFWFAKGSETNNTNNGGPRIYFLKRCSGAGCPYTASWLAHVNLYRRIPWAMESTKMVNDIRYGAIMCIYVPRSFLYVCMYLCMNDMYIYVRYLCIIDTYGLVYLCLWM